MSSSSFSYTNGLVAQAVVFGKLDVELDVEIALLVRVLVDGHALLGHGANAARREYFAGRLRHDERAAVQMADDELEAAQSLRDVERVRHEEVVVVACEHVVLGLLEDDDEVTGLDAARLGVALAAEGDLLAVLHALVDGHLELLLVLDGLLAHALLAAVLLVDDLALAGAIAAHRLDLLHHARSDLLVLHGGAATLAALALLCRACLASRAIFQNSKSKIN